MIRLRPDGFTESHPRPSPEFEARHYARLRRYFDAHLEVRLCSARSRVLASEALARLAAAGLAK